MNDKKEVILDLIDCLDSNDAEHVYDFILELLKTKKDRITNDRNWSKELQELSRDVLYNGRCIEPCHVKHWRKTNSHGTVSVIEGINTDKWNVITEDGTVERFDSVDALIAAGWVVD